MASAQALLRNFNNVKTLPHVEIRLSKLISDENSTMREFEEVIRLDPTLVLRLLRMVNSSYYGLRQKINSISRALVFVGMKNLRNMVVTEALKGIVGKGSKNGMVTRNGLWLHSATVGICGQMISERIFEKKGEDAFLCGILHDIGMIIEDQVAKDLFVQTCEAYDPESKSITDYEREIIGTDHCELGSLLAKTWKLPAEVQKGIQDHHNVLDQVSPSSVTGIIQTADYMACQMKHPALPGMHGVLSPNLASHIRENLAEYRALSKDLPDEISKAMDIYKIEEE
jgi:HD-like signal output (HDOD) protein